MEETKFQKTVSFFKDHAWVLGIFGLSATTLISATLYALFFTYGKPEVDAYTRGEIYKMFTDSSKVWGEQLLANRPKGFRSKLADATKLSKDSVVSTLSEIIDNENENLMSLTYLMDNQRYQVGFNTTIFLMSTEPYSHKGVSLRKTRTHENGKYDVYYKDGFNKWWKAIFYTEEDAYYFIPDYTNGERIKCT